VRYSEHAHAGYEPRYDYEYDGPVRPGYEPRHERDGPVRPGYEPRYEHDDPVHPDHEAPRDDWRYDGRENDRRDERAWLYDAHAHAPYGEPPVVPPHPDALGT
jgi:hypothetical protein